MVLGECKEGSSEVLVSVHDGHAFGRPYMNNREPSEQNLRLRYIALK